MSLQQQITDLSVRIGTEFKAVRAGVGDKAALATSNKSNLVAAINELAALVANATEIQDTAGAGVLTKTWSADKIVTALTTLKAEIVGGAPDAYDTLLEIANALQGDDADINAIMTALGNRVRYDAAQVLTAPQQAQARENIGAVATADIGDPNANFVAIFEGAL